MVGKPGSGTPPPGTGASGAQAGQAAQKGAVTGLAAWWKNLTAQSEPVRTRVSSAASGLRSKASGLKFPSMPVDVKVDILRPTMDAVRDSVHTFWVQLPPPVQQAAPYVGVAVGSGMLVFAVQQVRLNNQRKTNTELTQHVEKLKTEQETLLVQLRDVQTKPRTDLELRMASAVAEATTAAAAAAEAAANAAVACIVPRKRGAVPGTGPL